MGTRLIATDPLVAYAELVWEEIDISPVSNTSVISWELIFHSLTDDNSCSKNLTAIVTIDGTQYGGTITKGSYPSGSYSIRSGTTTVAHNADGSKTVSLSFSVNGGTWATWAKLEASGTRELTVISRKATITSAPNFTDEENPTIYYNNPAQGSVTSLQACISSTGASVDITEYRDIEKTGSSYTFVLTETEKSALYALVTQGNSVSVRFYIRTIVDGNYYFSYVTRTFTIANPEPTLAPTVKDVNARTLELTGDENTLIKYYSNAAFTTGAQALTGASIASQYVINGSQRVDNSASGTIEGVDSNTFYFSATDTRGFTKKTAVVFSEDSGNYIPYVKLTNHLEASVTTATGTLTFTVSGKYYAGSFGAKNNSMEIEYALRELGGDIIWTKLGVVTPNVDADNNYTFSYTITSGLDYSAKYELTVNVIDELTPVQSVVTTVSAIPIFDWGEDDFKHNTKVFFGDNVILEERKTIRGKASDGSDLQLLGLNASDNLSVGWGGYNTGEQDTLIYGTNVKLHTKNKIYVNNEELEYVVEQASNGTWFYRKWSSGRVELYGYQNISNLACNTALGGWYRTAVQTAPSFPFTVYNPKAVAAYESAGYGALFWPTTRTTESKPTDFYLIRPVSSSGITGVVNFYITGTWQ